MRASVPVILNASPLARVFVHLASWVDINDDPLTVPILIICCIEDLHTESVGKIPVGVSGVHIDVSVPHLGAIGLLRNPVVQVEPDSISVIIDSPSVMSVLPRRSIVLTSHGKRCQRK